MSRYGNAEFGFELACCRWAEENWPLESLAADEPAIIVARQLGTKRRRWDTIVLECEPAALRRRARFGTERLDSDLLHIVRNAPTEWDYYRDALPDPGYPWRYVRESIHEAADRGIIERRRSGNRIEIRRKWSYPDWLRRIVAIENKPDLEASAADRLGSQLEYDIAMALADEVWVATESSASAVEPALFENLPVEAGIVALEPNRLCGEVVWHAGSLPVAESGTRILERPANGDRSSVAARFEYVDPDVKAGRRLEIAERAYERGWRSFVETMRPDCRQFELRSNGQLLPHCRAKGRLPTAAECSGSCGSFEPEPPAWRTRGWPIEGGPGTRLQKLLADRRRRRRPAHQ